MFGANTGPGATSVWTAVAAGWCRAEAARRFQRTLIVCWTLLVGTPPVLRISAVTPDFDWPEHTSAWARVAPYLIQRAPGRPVDPADVDLERIRGGLWLHPSVHVQRHPRGNVSNTCHTAQNGRKPSGFGPFSSKTSADPILLMLFVL